MSHHAEKARMLAEWNSIAPLGRPVVPDVKSTSHRSSGCTAAARASASCRETSCAASKEVAERHAPRRHGTAQHDRLTDALAAGCVGEEVDVIRAQEVGHREQPGGLHDPDRVARLVALEAGVQRGHDAADGLARERGHRPLPAVGRPDRDTLAGLHTRCDHRPGGVADLRDELCERPSHVAVDHAFDVGEPAGRPPQDGRDRQRGRVGAVCIVGHRTRIVVTPMTDVILRA